MNYFKERKWVPCQYKGLGDLHCHKRATWLCIQSDLIRTKVYCCDKHKKDLESGFDFFFPMKGVDIDIPQEMAFLFEK